MKERTIEILKFFSEINKKMLFVEGEELCIANIEGSVMAKAILPERMTKNFAFYDVTEFLGTYSLFEAPTLTFDEDYLTIVDSKNKNKVKYYYSSSLGIVNVYNTDIESNKGEELAKFTLEKGALDTAKRASSVLGLDDFMLTVNGVKLLNLEANNHGNEFDLEVKDLEIIDADGINEEERVLIFKELTFIPDTYYVTFYENLVSFKSANGDVIYYITYVDV